MREPLPSLREDNPSIPQSIENIIRRATAKNPKNRYDSARSMHEDLLTALNDDRINEPVYEYKYPENENEGKKNKKAEKEEDALEDAKIEKLGEDETEKVPALEENEETKGDKKNRILIIVLAIIFALIGIGCGILCCSKVFKWEGCYSS